MSRARALLYLAILAPALAHAQGQSTQEIRKEMARIRTTTNWEDPSAAAAATRKIEELSRQIMRAAKPEQFDAEGKAKAGSQADILELAGKTVEQGEGATADLGKTVREEVERREKEEKDPTIRNATFLNELDTLILDVSQPEGRAIADQIGKLRRIKRLVVHGGETGVAYDLNALLGRAGGLPLEELAIVNFRSFLVTVPAGVGRFKSLRSLSLFNNAISSVPGSLGPATLATLHLDGNPIATVAGPLRSMRGLKTLGLYRTGVGAAEVAEIRKLLPACKVEGP
jgi:Leucine-rich repeat (LRR) protein